MRLPPLPALPVRLPAAAPGWSETTDVVVVGSGVAGLTTALHLREAGLHVTVVTKVNIDDGSTRWAQGGIAAVLDPLDSPDAHAADTIAAGAGLCDPAMVDLMVTEGPARLRYLIRTGAAFDRHPDGTLLLTREGGHRADRIVHAGGDATGAEVQRALHGAVRRDPWIRLVEHALVVDLLTGPRSGGGRRVTGVTLHVLGEGTPDGVGAIRARAVVLASGGMGQVFASTTNPVVSTGDGVALALRAGATVADLEFVQFHPTSLYLDPGRRVGRAGNGAGAGAGPAAQQPLVSEALRGEGAHLVDPDGKRFLVGQHELAELAPRDVVAKAMHRVMLASGTAHVWLDARHLGREFLERRFPTIVATCRAAGVEPSEEWIPVAPAAHYASGGLRTDRHGRTNLPGLYACGEVACTGVHGANRLASNSLLEALVFARRIATDIAASLPGAGGPDAVAHGTGTGGPDAVAHGTGTGTGPAKETLQQAMAAGAGVLRTADSLARAAQAVTQAAGAVKGTPPGGTGGRGGTDVWELANLATVAGALVAAAYARTETRGCHWRDDFPEPDERWRGHLAVSLSADGYLNLTWEGA
jgi:L-aspartate oxidase